MKVWAENLKRLVSEIAWHTEDVLGTYKDSMLLRKFLYHNQEGTDSFDV